MTENIDSLLNDLEHLVMPSPRGEGSMSFKHVPHPPQIDKSQNNPKNKFVVPPASSYLTHSYHIESELDSTKQSAKSSPPSKYSYSATTPPKDNSVDDSSSLDSLLEMLQSPGREKDKAIKPSSTLPLHNDRPSGSGARIHGDKLSTPLWGVGSVAGSPPSASATRHQSTPPSVSSDAGWDSPGSTVDPGNSGTSYGFSGGQMRGTPSPPKSTGGGGSGSVMFGGTSASTGAYGNGGAVMFPPAGFSSASSSSTFGGASASNATGGKKTSTLVTLHALGTAGGSGVKTRCSRVVLGGTSLARGPKTSAFSKSACDRLRCLQCNFEVLQFADEAWDTSAVDYMFFRNNVPNIEKLSVNLMHSPGTCAYCCQCTWRNVEGEETLIAGSATQPQWTCTAH